MIKQSSYSLLGVISCAPAISVRLSLGHWSLLDTATNHALLPPSRLYTSRKSHLSLTMARPTRYAERDHASQLSEDFLSRGIASALESMSRTMPGSAFCSRVGSQYNVA